MSKFLHDISQKSMDWSIQKKNITEDPEEEGYELIKPDIASTFSGYYGAFSIKKHSFTPLFKEHHIVKLIGSYYSPIKDFELPITSYVQYAYAEPDFEETEIISQVIEIYPDFISVNALVDAEKRVFKMRKFEINPLKHLNLQEGDILKINIKTRPSEKRFIFSKGESSSALLFKKQIKGIFKDVIDTPFFKKAN